MVPFEHRVVRALVLRIGDVWFEEGQASDPEKEIEQAFAILLSFLPIAGLQPDTKAVIYGSEHCLALYTALKAAAENHLGRLTRMRLRQFDTALISLAELADKLVDEDHAVVKDFSSPDVEGAQT